MTAQLKGYHRIISEATGRTNISDLDKIEDCMRNDIFRSTLDWQTRGQLIEAARLAETVLLRSGDIRRALIVGV